jgi:hypothetical protein
MEEDVRGIPFWDDLSAVTGAIPPWGIFKVLAEHPQAITHVPIPLTYLLTPRDQIHARLCTGLDHKLLVRRSTVRDPISFEGMASDLKAVFDARGSDGQPFVCTAYGQDWRPYFVLSESFHIFVQYCRHMCGESLSSYGPEEQREATMLFPSDICCIQAYIPLESQSRYLAVSLRSTIKTMVEIYRAPHLGRGCFSNTTDTLDAIVVPHSRGQNDYFQPLGPGDNDAKIAARMSGSILSCLRKECNMRTPGLVCEFVRDVQGDLYLVSASRCSHPQVQAMSAPIKPCLVSDLKRILGKQRASLNLSAWRRTAVFSSWKEPPESASTRSANVKTGSASARSENYFKTKFALMANAPLTVDKEERPEAVDTQASSSHTKKKKFALAIHTSDRGLAETRNDTLSDMPDKHFLDLDSPHTESKNLADETFELVKGGRVLSSAHEARLLVRKRTTADSDLTKDMPPQTRLSPELLQSM